MNRDIQHTNHEYSPSKSDIQPRPSLGYIYIYDLNIHTGLKFDDIQLTVIVSLLAASWKFRFEK